MRRFRGGAAFAAAPQSAAGAAAANKLKRSSIGHKLADKMKNYLSTMALILSWYAEGQSHEQEFRTVSQTIWMSTCFPDLRSMNFEPFQRS